MNRKKSQYTVRAYAAVNTILQCNDCLTIVGIEKSTIYFSDWVYLDKTLFDFISIHFRSPLLPFFSPTSVKESFSLVELVGVSKVEDMTLPRSKHAQQHIEPASKTPHSAVHRYLLVFHKNIRNCF